MKTKVYTRKQLGKLLSNNGWTFDRCNGDHYIYKKGNRIVVINDNINKHIARRVIKAAQIVNANS